MRRDDDVLRIPQRIVFGEWFRIRHVERRAAQLLGIQRVDQGGLVEDLAAGDVDNEGAAAAGEDVELGRAEQVGRRRCQGQRHDEHVEVLGQEAVQVRLGRPAVPRDRDAAVRVAGVRHVVALVGAGGGRQPWGGGIGEDVGAERVEGACHCAGFEGWG